MWQLNYGHSFDIDLDWHALSAPEQIQNVPTYYKEYMY